MASKRPGRTTSDLYLGQRMLFGHHHTAIQVDAIIVEEEARRSPSGEAAVQAEGAAGKAGRVGRVGQLEGAAKEGEARAQVEFRRICCGIRHLHRWVKLASWEAERWGTMKGSRNRTRLALGEVFLTSLVPRQALAGTFLAQRGTV